MYLYWSLKLYYSHTLFCINFYIFLFFICLNIFFKLYYNFIYLILFIFSLNLSNCYFCPLTFIFFNLLKNSSPFSIINNRLRLFTFLFNNFSYKQLTLRIINIFYNNFLVQLFRKWLTMSLLCIYLWVCSFHSKKIVSKRLFFVLVV